MGFRPDMPAGGGLGHRWITDRPGEGWGLAGHPIEKGFGAAHAQGDDSEEPALEIRDGGVERLQDGGDPWNHLFGEQLLWIEQGVMAPQGVLGGDGLPPIEHLLPIGMVAAGGGFDQEARVAGLAARPGGHKTLLAGRIQGEKLAQHAVGRVEQIGREVAAGVHEARLQAAFHPIHHRPTGGLAAPFKGQQINVENRLGHGGEPRV